MGKESFETFDPHTEDWFPEENTLPPDISHASASPEAFEEALPAEDTVSLEDIEADEARLEKEAEARIQGELQQSPDSRFTKERLNLTVDGPTDDSTSASISGDSGRKLLNRLGYPNADLTLLTSDDPQDWAAAKAEEERLQEQKADDDQGDETEPDDVTLKEAFDTALRDAVGGGEDTAFGEAIEALKFDLKAGSEEPAQTPTEVNDSGNDNENNKGDDNSEQSTEGSKNQSGEIDVETSSEDGGNDEPPKNTQETGGDNDDDGEENDAAKAEDEAGDMFASLDKETREGGAERQARLDAAIDRVEADPEETARIDAVAAEVEAENPELLDAEETAEETNVRRIAEWEAGDREGPLILVDEAQFLMEDKTRREQQTEEPPESESNATLRAAGIDPERNDLYLLPPAVGSNLPTLAAQVEHQPGVSPEDTPQVSVELSREFFDKVLKDHRAGKPVNQQLLDYAQNLERQQTDEPD